MKKALLFLGAFLAMAYTAGAESFKLGQFQYTTTGENTVELTKADNKDAGGTVYTKAEIPATVNYNNVDYTVTSIGEDAFKWTGYVQVTLPGTVVTIGRSAFNGADKLVDITIPEGVKTIGDYSFSSTAISSITIPSSVEEIGSSAFFTCKSLTSIKFNEGLKKIGMSAFYKVPVTKIELPESVTELGAKAFYFCNKMTSVKLPSSLKVLGTGTFLDCSALTSVTIPEGVTEIGQECFLRAGISEITIPASVTAIGTSAFAKTPIETIRLASGNSAFTLVDGVLYDSARKLLYAVPMKGKTNVKVDDKCIGINGGAFWGSEVTDVTLPEGMLAIDDYAFCQSSLANINFPAKMTYIGEQGFADTQLTEITLPANMPYVLDGAFAGCENLTSVTIPSGVKLIYNHAFHNDKKITSIKCLGSVAPEIDDVYETYDSPFFGISETTPLYIPKGSTDSYKAAGWDSYFVLTEEENSSFTYEKATPADGTVLGKYADMKVELTFGSDVSIVNYNPEVFLRKGSELSGAIIESDYQWRVSSAGSKSVRVWSDDGDGYTQSFSPEQDTEYYLIIPAGIVKSANGDLNERIVIKWVGPAAPKPFIPVSVTPENGSTLSSGYFDMKFLITFDEDITIIDFGPNAHLRESDPATGKEIQPDISWKATKEDEKTLNLWAADYDYCVQSFMVNDNLTYYMTIPAGIVRNAAGDKNEEIVIELKGKTSGIEGIGTDNDIKAVEHFDIHGRKVSEGAKGMHIVRMSDGSVRKVIVK